MWVGPPDHSLALNVFLPHDMENAFSEKEPRAFPCLHNPLISTPGSSQIARADMGVDLHHSPRHGHPLSLSSM